MKLRASVDSPFKMGTSDAYVNSCMAPTKNASPVCPGVYSCSNTVNPVAFTAKNAHTKPSIAKRQLMVSGAGPSNANTLVKDLSPVSGRLSTSGQWVQ